MTSDSHRLRRMTTFAIVERVARIRPHRDPRITGLEVLILTNGVQLVTGKHYREGDLGIYLRPGCLIPGLLAEQLWLVGKKRAAAWFEVRAMPIGIHDAPDELKEDSLGLWCGEWYMNDKTAESATKAAEFGSELDAQGFIHWRFWRPEWQPGHTIDGHFGIVEAEPQPIGARHDPRLKAPHVGRRRRGSARSALNESLQKVGNTLRAVYETGELPS